VEVRKNPLKVLGPHGDESDVQAIREVEGVICKYSNKNRSYSGS